MDFRSKIIIKPCEEACVVLWLVLITWIELVPCIPNLLRALSSVLPCSYNAYGHWPRDLVIFNLVETVTDWQVLVM